MGRELEESLLQELSCGEGRESGLCCQESEEPIKAKAFNHSLRWYEQESGAHPLSRSPPWNRVLHKSHGSVVDVTVVLLLRKPLKKRQFQGP